MRNSAWKLVKVEQADHENDQPKHYTSTFNRSKAMSIALAPDDHREPSRLQERYRPEQGLIRVAASEKPRRYVLLRLGGSLSAFGAVSA
jgi:hypothetical protein